MNLVISSVLLFSLVGFIYSDCPTNQKQVVCYWGTWSVYRKEIGQFTSEEIDTSLCTIAVYAFAGLNQQLVVDHLDEQADIVLGGYWNFTGLRQKNPCLKTTLAIGGWNEGSIKYSVVASTEEGRKNFAEQILKILIYYNFDGVDIDWEYPTSRGGIPADVENFPLLLKAVKDRISPWGLTLSIAVAASDLGTDATYNVKAIADVVDYIHLMAYDYTPSTSNVTGLSAAFTVTKNAVNYWLKNAPAEKLILGLQCYGRSFVLADATKHGIGDPVASPGIPGWWTNEDGFLAYYEILDALENDMTQVEEDGTNYAYLEIDWITFENEKTVAEKTQYAMDQKLGGVMLWSIDLDDFSGQFGPAYPLLNTANGIVSKYNK